MPKWLKPEINDPMYWLHVGIIAISALALLDVISIFGWVPANVHMLTVVNVLISIPILGLSDIFAHTILQLD